MATALHIDTLAVVKELRAAGFTDEQAEAVTRAVARGGDPDLSHLAAKADLKAEIESLRQSTRGDIAELKAELLKWFIGLIGVQTIAVIGALVALTRVVAR